MKPDSVISIDSKILHVLEPHKRREFSVAACGAYLLHSLQIVAGTGARYVVHECLFNGQSLLKEAVSFEDMKEGVIEFSTPWKTRLSNRTFAEIFIAIENVSDEERAFEVHFRAISLPERVVGFEPAWLAPGETKKLVAHPQRPFLASSLFIDKHLAPGLDLSDVKIGSFSAFESGSPISAMACAMGKGLRLDYAPCFQEEISIVVRNRFAEGTGCDLFVVASMFGNGIDDEDFDEESFVTHERRNVTIDRFADVESPESLEEALKSTVYRTGTFFRPEQKADAKKILGLVLDRTKAVSYDRDEFPDALMQAIGNGDVLYTTSLGHHLFIVGEMPKVLHSNAFAHVKAGEVLDCLVHAVRSGTLWQMSVENALVFFAPMTAPREN